MHGPKSQLVRVCPSPLPLLLPLPCFRVSEVRATPRSIHLTDQAHYLFQICRRHVRATAQLELGRERWPHPPELWAQAQEMLAGDVRVRVQDVLQPEQLRETWAISA